MKRYLSEEVAFIAAVRQGRADIAAGRFVTHEAMNTELDAIEAAHSAEH